MVYPIARRSLIEALLPFAGVQAGELIEPDRWRPSRSIRIVIAFPTGGASDIAARWIARRLAPRLGRPVVIENRPGANGIIGSEHAANALPDGHTLLLTTADTHSVNPAVHRRLPYRPENFVPVAPVARLVFALASRRGLDARNVQGFIAMARQAASPLTFASWGVASTSQIMMEMLLAGQGLTMQHVPFQGSAAATAALLAEQVDAMMAPVGLATAQGGRVTILGIAAAARFPGAPLIPTLAEQGIPLVADLWVALFAPPGTPGAVTDRLATEIHDILSSNEARAFLVSIGLIPDTQDRANFLSYLREEDIAWRGRVERLGLRLND